MSDGIELENRLCRAIESRHDGWFCWVNLYGDWLARTIGDKPAAILRITRESQASASERARALEDAIERHEAEPEGTDGT